MKIINTITALKKIIPVFIGLFMVCCFSTCPEGFAQTMLPFDNYTVNNGLPSSEVYHVMQDSKGFMWFSTDHGVCRYDGYQFKTFTTADGLADNTIFECNEDYKGRIWFRSFSGRLSYFYNDSIYRLSENDKLVGILHRSNITSLGVDTNENLYITTQLLPGVIKLDLNHKKHAELLPVPMNSTYLLQVSGINQPLIGAA